MQRRRFDPGFLFAAALLCAWSFSACGRAPAPSGAFDLERSLAGAERCQVSAPDAATLAIVRAALARRPPLDLTFDLTLEAERSTHIGDDPRIWIGTPHSKGAETALAHLGLEAIAGGFRFQGQEFRGPCDGVIATVADPDRPLAVMELVLGNDLKSALRWIRDWTPSARQGWQLFHAGAIWREGRVGPAGEAQVDGCLEVAAAEADLSKGQQHGVRVDFDWSAPASFDPERDASWLEALDRAASGVRARLNPITPFDAQWRLGLRILERQEDLGRTCRVHAFAHLRPLEVQDELSLVHAPGSPDNAAYELARALALAGAGEPRAAWLADGVAAASAKAWFGRSLESWLAHLSSGDLVPSVEQLVREDSGLSAHQLSPLRGALLEACEELQGADFAAKMWGVAAESIALPSDLEFRAWLTRTLGAQLELARSTRVERRAAAISRQVRRGACLVPSPLKADPYAGGFGSSACDKSLTQLHKLGSSAVALCWCAALESSEPRMFGDGRSAWSQADDASLFFTIGHAQSLGMEVLLLPQLISSENGGWAGQVMLTTQSSQRALFAQWRGFLTNLGLLAELAGVDVLSLGSEAPDTSVTRESEKNRRSAADLAGLRTDWNILIEAGRDAFGGGLTYASRWDGEAQGIEFWKSLDFVGQNLFAPCGEPTAANAPSADEFMQRIVGAFAHLSQMSTDNGLRGLVTEIGISSTAGGWRQPSRPLGALDLDLQTRFYDGLMRALQIGRRQEIAPAGLFLWCWWTDPESGGSAERGFTPQHKPAEAALGRALRVR